MDERLTLLSLETSTDHCSVALLAGSVLDWREEQAGQRHSEILLPMVDTLLKAAGLRVVDVDGVAFGAGPGSFTGLRIACGVAQGLAFAFDHPVVPVGTLEAIAEAAGAERVVACLDARMGEIYHAAFERDGDDWRELLPPSLCRPDLAPQLPGDGWVGCGSGFDRYPELLARRYQAQLHEVRAGIYPHAREIARLGMKYLNAGRSVAADQAVPLYVRDRVALKMHEQKK